MMHAVSKNYISMVELELELEETDFYKELFSSC